MRKIRLTESQLHKVIKESVKRVLKETDASSNIQATVDKLKELEDNICELSRDIKRAFFEHERLFDKPQYDKFNYMGIDNPPFSYGTQGELSYAFDKESWDEWTEGRGPKFEDELRSTYEWFVKLTELAESEGYGASAASRGFDVTHPIGIFWLKSYQAIKTLRKMAELTNIKL